MTNIQVYRMARRKGKMTSRIGQGARFGFTLSITVGVLLSFSLLGITAAVLYALFRTQTNPASVLQIAVMTVFGASIVLVSRVPAARIESDKSPDMNGSNIGWSDGEITIGKHKNKIKNIGIYIYLVRNIVRYGVLIVIGIVIGLSDPFALLSGGVVAYVYGLADQLFSKYGLGPSKLVSTFLLYLAEVANDKLNIVKVSDDGGVFIDSFRNSRETPTNAVLALEKTIRQRLPST
jgi:hypothetical protein